MQDKKLEAETSPVPFILVSLRTVISSFPVINIIHVHSYAFRLFIPHMLHWLCEITNEEFINKLIYEKKVTDSFPFTLSIATI
jgi:hypothetical protein